MPFNIGLSSPTVFLAGFKGANRRGRTACVIELVLRKVREPGANEQRVKLKEAELYLKWREDWRKIAFILGGVFKSGRACFLAMWVH